MKSGCGVDKKILIVMLLLLLIVVIGLGVAITVVILNNNDDSSVADCFQDGVDVRECIDEKAWSYIEADEDEEDGIDGCEDALKLYDEIPINKIDKETIASLYNEAYSLSLYCGDEISQEYWGGKYRETMNQAGGRS